MLVQLQERGFNSQYQLAEMYVDGELEPRLRKRGWEAAVGLAISGFTYLQRRLGLMYSEAAKKNPRRYEQAFVWLRQASESGDALAQFELGQMYLAGRGVRQSDPSAAYWFEQAAHQGVGRAQYELGLAYRDGRGVSQNPWLAFSWMRKAANRDWAPAQHELGNMFLQGFGVGRNRERAFEWYHRAACHGHELARLTIMNGDDRVARILH